MPVATTFRHFVLDACVSRACVYMMKDRASHIASSDARVSASWRSHTFFSMRISCRVDRSSWKTLRKWLRASRSRTSV
ncbi:hypothetical protein Y032_0731g1898 [Ancylostoma ceylanicum]|uniref:Uncharacterized protein n=1 Tax=Ancylostoma ceylanicum TaxID=53326 RepID=A0A016WF46_9BILA|nr:hypothetical protein Y032_0731g1898 [Ancylostoma ceylanicum]